MKFKFYVTDPKDKRESVTLTLLIAASIICLARVALSDITILSYTFPHFNGTDCALIIGAFGGLYWGRKYSEKNNNKIESTNNEENLNDITYNGE